MKELIFILTIVFSTNCFGQQGKKFVISEVISKESYSKLDRSKFKVDRNNIFEDSNYIVSKSCSGEWGGTIKFKNKKTGIEYSAVSTCPVVVTKFNNSYFVTNTLAHLSGSSEILEIRNPNAMSVFELPKPRKTKGDTIIEYVGDDEAKSSKGTKSVVDSIGVLTLATFLFHAKLYHVVTDFAKTYLTEIIGNKFISIDTISNESLWTYDPEVFVTIDKHSIIFFDNEKVSGYLDIFDNTIKVVRRK
jgi:hypothetical protein